ncbi:MAG: branched-chain amino acid ABC transporter permease [Patescibacteria group bacterium]
MDIIAQIALNAIIAGAIYSLVALGFNLIYSTARFFDIGYGALAAVGGYAVFYFYKTLEFGLEISIVLGVLAAGVLGLLINWLIYRPLRARKASSTVTLIASLGVLTVIQAVVAILFTSQFQTLSRLPALHAQAWQAGDVSGQATYQILGGVITQTQVLILGAALTIMVALAFVLKYSIFGKAVRAVADDAEVASIVGIDSEKILAWIFFIGSMIGGLAGIAIGFDTGIQPTMGLVLLLKGIIAAIIGGIGSVWGGVLGAFVLALVENLGAWQFSGEWKDAIAFLVLIIFLIFRPQGILNK